MTETQNPMILIEFDQNTASRLVRLSGVNYAVLPARGGGEGTECDLFLPLTDETWRALLAGEKTALGCLSGKLTSSAVSSILLNDCPTFLVMGACGEERTEIEKLGVVPDSPSSVRKPVFNFFFSFGLKYASSPANLETDWFTLQDFADWKRKASGKVRAANAKAARGVK